MDFVFFRNVKLRKNIEIKHVTEAVGIKSACSNASDAQLDF